MAKLARQLTESLSKYFTRSGGTAKAVTMPSLDLPSGPGSVAKYNATNAFIETSSNRVGSPKCCIRTSLSNMVSSDANSLGWTEMRSRTAVFSFLRRSLRSARNIPASLGQEESRCPRKHLRKIEREEYCANASMKSVRVRGDTDLVMPFLTTRHPQNTPDTERSPRLSEPAFIVNGSKRTQSEMELWLSSFTASSGKRALVTDRRWLGSGTGRSGAMHARRRKTKA